MCTILATSLLQQIVANIWGNTVQPFIAITGNFFCSSVASEYTVKPIIMQTIYCLSYLCTHALYYKTTQLAKINFKWLLHFHDW